MNLGEQFKSEVVTMQPEQSIETAMRKMKDRNVGAVVVVEGRKVKGIVTDRDVALAAILEGVRPGTPVSEIMTKDVMTIWEDQGVFNATQYLEGRKVRRLPIINRDNELVGMVTLDDLFALLARELFNVSKAVAPALAEK